MRIAYLPDGTTINTAYRSIGPMLALAERGHETRQLDPAQRGAWGATLSWCDVLHVHRVCDRGVVELARAARAAGAAVVWDDDDDVTRAPKGTDGHRDAGGMRGARRVAARARLFEHVDLVTTPSAHLAGVFRDAGAPEVRVVENYVFDRHLDGRAPREPVTVGWVAGYEHRLDLERVPIVAALERLLEVHADVRVVTVGLELPFRHPRYRYVAPVPFERLLHTASAFDVGIAPLSPHLAISRARSNIKVKEYAAVGVPWLASPIGPYAGLGEREGGRLVADDRWFDELDQLVRKPRTRRRLAKRAERWGGRQWLTRNAERWEEALGWVVGRARDGSVVGARGG